MATPQAMREREMLKLLKDLLGAIYDVLLKEVALRIIDFFWNLFDPLPEGS